MLHFFIKYRQQGANINGCITRKQFTDFLFQVICFRPIFLRENVSLGAYISTTVRHHVEGVSVALVSLVGLTGDVGIFLTSTEEIDEVVGQLVFLFIAKGIEALL